MSDQSKKVYRVAVAGNPNSGKTCIFNNLTGGSQRVGNYPGVTVEFVEGITSYGDDEFNVIDLPGTYSMTAYSQEEVVARDFIIHEKPDVIIDVVDASNLERNLYLAVQLMELRVPIVMALNMIDVADSKGIVVNARMLGELFGIIVVPTMANKNQGMEELKKACLDTIRDKIFPKPLSYTHELQGALLPLEKVIEKTPEFCGECQTRWLALKLLEDDDDINAKLSSSSQADKIKGILRQARKHISTHSGEDSVTAVVEARYGIAAGAAKESTQMTEQKKRMLSDRIDAVVCNRLAGPMVLCLVVYSLFVFVFNVADELKWIPLFNGEYLSPVGSFELFFDTLSASVEQHVSHPILRSFFKDGVIGGVGGVLSFVPLIFFMFLFIAVLEDTGYIARVAFILDRILRTFGLQGKSILAMIVSGGLGGGGCAVPGVMATRTLREEKDRLVTILVAPMMNCGAKMPVYAMLIAAFFANARGAMMFLLWLLSWVFALFSAFCLRKWIIKGEQTPFVMELPVYHIPTLKGVLMHTWHRTWLYIKKAGTIILAINVVLWLLMYFPKMDTSKFKREQQEAAGVFFSKIKNSRYASILSDTQVKRRTFKFIEEVRCLQKISEPYKSNKLRHLKKLDPLRCEFAFSWLRAEKNISSDSSVKDPVLAAFQEYVEFIRISKLAETQAQLRNSIAGRFGAALSPISQLAGFTWKENIALIGGFAAKEVVIGTLGTAYAMGETNPEESETLSSRLANDPDWNPLRAFVLMIFVMVYAPCFVAVVAIKRETGSWKWAIFSTVYSTSLALVLAVVIYQLGSLW